ncbi:MAG TPA: excinuclease ABC subunit UvrA, partial [Planctomycetota bacterium]|nr:excinuclease ABC subunit UvrA [Planctomycetota bacterium]
MSTRLPVITIRGAREHNLKNVDVEIPRDKLVVFTGLSGSGKSSLAFDTVYAEGQRRYVESLSSYARQFLGQMDKPDVDFIDGLSPAISIDQKSTSRNPRSTVGTVTEIYDYLRLLYARVGIPHCPQCGAAINPQTPQEIVDGILALPEGTRVLVLAPVVRARKGNYTQLLQDLTKEGFSRVRVDGTIHHLSDDIKVDRYVIHDIEIVVDRLVLKAEDRQRLSESVEVALKHGEGLSYIHLVDEGRDLVFSEHFACHACQQSFGEITPKLFSFNSPYGACETCKGLGSLQEIDPELVFDKSRSLSEEALLPWRGSAGSYLGSLVEAAADVLGIDRRTPLADLTDADFQRLCYGPDEPIRLKFTYLNGAGQRRRGYHLFAGVIPFLSQRFLETTSDYIRGILEQYMSDKPCPACKGKRLKPLPLAVTVGDLDIDQLTRLTVEELMGFMGNLRLPEMKAQIAAQVLKEIRARVQFLFDVGLNYITLHRSANTLSGGEAQRIRLATQIGSNLTGVLYILDEPTIGLHQRDNTRLIRTLKHLRDLGNTVIVVEHDEDTILAADHLIDLGPGAGEHGGRIVGVGSHQDLIRMPESPTGRFLQIKYGQGLKDLYKAAYRKPTGWLTIKKPTHNNLRGDTAKFPLGVMCAVTGVSGSGKSSLVNETLYRAVAHHFHLRTERPGPHTGITGLDQLDGVIVVDQSPIGRTPRS